MASMLELDGAIWFRSGSRDWGGHDRIALLAAIGEQGSITAAAKAVREPATLERLAHDAAIAVGSTSADYAKFIEAERKRWKPVIARAKIKPD